MAIGSDEKIYGCTYPNAKLIRFNTETGKGEDLGRMSMTEKYGRFIAADTQGFVYMGIGTVNIDIVAYEIATGKHRSILPQSIKRQGAAKVVRATDGIIYGNVGNGKWFRLEGFNAVPVPTPTDPTIKTALTLNNGQRVIYEGSSVSVQNQGGKSFQATTGYRGKNINIYRVGLGPDDRLYGSTAMPCHFFWASPENDQWQEIAIAGNGEIYSFLSWRDKLISAAYALISPIMIYEPGRPWEPGTKSNGNPWLIHYKGENIGWRPMVMIAGLQEKVYIGAISGYGLLGGPLCVFDPSSGIFEQYPHVVNDHSVTALEVTSNGMIVGGTTVEGGSGNHSTQTEAKIFLWDPDKRQKLFEIVPATGNTRIEALCVGRDGLVYGFGNKRIMFVFDPLERKIIATKTSSIGNVIYNAIGRAADGNLYGVHTGGVFSIDEKEHNVKQIAVYPLGITGDFSIRGNRIYFTSGPQIFSYQLS